MDDATDTAAPEVGMITFGEERFQFAEIPRRLGWVRMVHPSCAAKVEFVNPTDARLNWYASIHDCDARLWWTRKV